MARIFTVTLMIICSLFAMSSACATRTVEELSKTMTGELAYGKVIPVFVSSRDEDKSAKLYWAEFKREGDIVKANVRATILSWPKDKWWVHVSIMDREGRQLAKSTGVLENSGITISTPAISEGDLQFTMGPVRDIEKAARFSVSIAQAAEHAEPNMGLVHVSFDWPWEMKGDRSIDLCVVGSEGDERAVEATLWRKVDGPVPYEPLSVLHGLSVRWQSGDETWVAVRSIGGLYTKDQAVPEFYNTGNLAPAVYRVSINSRPTPESPDPTPSEGSPALDLVANQKVKAVIRLKNGYPLTVNVTGAADGKPVPNTAILLRREDGMPVGERSSKALKGVPGDGLFRFNNLQPGVYSLEVGRRDWLSVLHPETIKVTKVEVKPGADNKITVPYEQINPWPEE